MSPKQSNPLLALAASPRYGPARSTLEEDTP